MEITGARDARPFSQNVFIFMQFSGEIQKKRSNSRLAHPIWEILDPPLYMHISQSLKREQKRLGFVHGSTMPIAKLVMCYNTNLPQNITKLSYRCSSFSWDNIKDVFINISCAFHIKSWASWSLCDQTRPVNKMNQSYLHIVQTFNGVFSILVLDLAKLDELD